MGSRFLIDADGANLAGFTTGDFEANLATLQLQSLVSSVPVKSTAGRALTCGLISASDCSFTPITSIGAAGGTIALPSSGTGPIASLKGLNAGPGMR